MRGRMKRERLFPGLPHVTKIPQPTRNFIINPGQGRYSVQWAVDTGRAVGDVPDKELLFCFVVF
jgi:hypothetical protein